ncbi:hypothetical protein AKJ09_07861 [Labilithrix luteola]|uniref:Uncharacterized protein n=1 Tax=Labilithrix luteola TaxID=1391654 RepID=A0A0K1Q637_9BACT|nr:hypothetical protein AKJ09_07861 [Labilithrix luteola]
MTSCTDRRFRGPRWARAPKSSVLCPSLSQAEFDGSFRATRLRGSERIQRPRLRLTASSPPLEQFIER